jgi:CO/xanthine dehydrogenase FAD-binding subunit
MTLAVRRIGSLRAEQMKPAPFAYVAASSRAQALGFLAEHGDETKVLAGGQSLVPVLNMRLARTSYLLDVNRAAQELGYIRQDDGHVAIGAMTRHFELMDSPVVAKQLPLLAASLPFIGHTAIRRRGTIGGSLVHADPSAELPAVAVALGAEMVLHSLDGERVVGADEFFITYFTTVARPDELLVEIRFPRQPAGEASTMRQLARRRGDFALAGVLATCATTPAGSLKNVRLTAMGVHEVPRRLADSERAVEGRALDERTVADARDAAQHAIEPESDMHASADYRRRMIGVLLQRALLDVGGRDAPPTS